MAQTVLIVDDEKNIVNIIAFNLKKEGYEVLTAGDGEEAVAIADEKNPDLILLDIMMPKMDGYEACRKIREKHNMPIIMLTARAEELDKVLGLEMGADDYVTKPFVPLELLARVNSHLRRYQKFLQLSSQNQPSHNLYVVGGLELDEETATVSVDGEVVKLTPMEYKILLLLMQNPGRVFPAEEIYQRVWNERAVNTDTVMVHLRNLRSKIEFDPKNPKYLKVVWGIGYKIEKI